MKTIVVFGDLLSDRTSEQYPEKIACDECYEKITSTDDDGIIHDGSGEIDEDSVCEYCSKTWEEEQEEQKDNG